MFINLFCQYEKGTKYGGNDMIIKNVSNGMTCTYEVKPDIDGCDCKASCQTSISCNVVYGKYGAIQRQHYSHLLFY